MEFVLLIVAVAATALLIHLTRHRALFAIIMIVGGSLLSWNLLYALPSGPYEFAGLTFALDPLLKLLILFAFAVNALLALVALMDPAGRESVSFLYWCWVPWFFALTVDSFALAVLVWGIGLYTLALTHAPGRAGQVGGAAHYLLIVILSVAGLLIANRFLELYPLTPDQTNLIQVGVLFLVWALGLALAVVPFHFWLSALAEETGLVFFTVLAGWGLTFGLWFLFELLRRFLWLSEKSNLLALLVTAGLATTIVGGLSAAAERRAGRWLAFASLFTLGPVLIDLGRARYDLLLNAGMGIVGRGLALALCAAGLTMFRATNQSWARAFSIGALVFGAAALVGFPFTPAFVSSLPIWSEYAVSDPLIFAGLLSAALGVWVGAARVAYPMIIAWRTREQATIARPEARQERTEGDPVEGRRTAEETGAGPDLGAKGIQKAGQVKSGQAGKTEEVKGDEEKADTVPANRGAAPLETYDPVQAVGEAFAKFWAWLRVLVGHSPRLLHGLLYLTANWQIVIGAFIVTALVMTILVLGVFPTLLFDPLTSAIGQPAFLK